jgi:hypothetical protein
MDSCCGKKEGGAPGLPGEGILPLPGPPEGCCTDPPPAAPARPAARTATPPIGDPVGWPAKLHGIPGIRFEDGVVIQPVQATQNEVRTFFDPFVADYDINLMHALMNVLDVATGGTGTRYPPPTQLPFTDGTTGPWYSLVTEAPDDLPDRWVVGRSLAENAYIDVLARIAGGFVMGAVSWQLSQQRIAHRAQLPRPTAKRITDRLRITHGIDPMGIWQGAFRVGEWGDRHDLPRPALLTRLAFAHNDNPWNKLLKALTPAGTPLGVMLGLSSPEPIPMPLQWDEAVFSGLEVKGPGSLRDDPIRISFMKNDLAKQLTALGDALATAGTYGSEGAELGVSLQTQVFEPLLVFLLGLEEGFLELVTLGTSFWALGREDLFANHALGVLLDMATQTSWDSLSAGATLPIDFLLGGLLGVSDEEMEAVLSCLLTEDDGARKQKKLEKNAGPDYWKERIEEIGVHPEPVVLLSDRLSSYGVSFGATQMPPPLVYNFCPVLLVAGQANIPPTHQFNIPTLAPQVLPPAFFAITPPAPLSVIPEERVAADAWLQWWTNAMPTYKAALVFDGLAELLWQVAVLDDAALAATGFLGSDGMVGAWIRSAARDSGLGTLVDGLAGISIGEIFRYAIRQYLTDLFLESMTNPINPLGGTPRANIDLESAHQVFCWMNTEAKRTLTDRALGPMVGIANPAASETVFSLLQCTLNIGPPRTLRVRSSIATILLGMPVQVQQDSTVGRLVSALSTGQTVSSCDVFLLRHWVRQARTACLLDLEATLRPQFISPRDWEAGELGTREPPSDSIPSFEDRL